MRWTSILLLALVPAFAQTTDTPKRTMVASPPGTRSVSNDAPGAGNADAALAQYRDMWRRMTPAQQKTLLDSGGYTPEQYERMLKQKAAPKAEPAAPRNTIDPSIDSLSKSLQDLNAIRDANLGRVQKGGCPPEVAARIADLKGKLQAYEAELNGVDAAAAAPGRPTVRSGANDPLSLAGDWYKRPAGQETAAPSAGTRESRESKLLDEVLAGGAANPPPQRRIDPKSPEAEQKRKAVEQDIARIKAEIDQLSGACAAARR